MNERTNQIKAIEVNESLRLQFMHALKSARPCIGLHTMNQYWWHAINALSSEMKKIHPDYAINWDSVEQMLLQSAEMGLNFDPRAKELFIDVQPGFNDNDALTVHVGLKYNGMKNRLVKTCNVRMLTTEIICEKDVFEWRGQWKEPLYIMANEQSDIRLGFGMVKLRNGDVLAYKLSKEELLELERLDIERATQIYGDPSSSLYQSAYRKRLFEIATLRFLYHQVSSMLADSEYDAQVTEREDAHQDIAKAMEAELNQLQAAG